MGRPRWVVDTSSPPWPRRTAARVVTDNEPDSADIAVVNLLRG